MGFLARHQRPVVDWVRRFTNSQIQHAFSIELRLTVAERIASHERCPSLPNLWWGEMASKP